jgi:hypothetical protein
MSRQSSFPPSLFAPGLAPEIERVFRPLCLPLAAPEAAALPAAIDEHLHAVRQARQRNEFLDLAAAEALAEGLKAFLDLYPDCSPAHRALIVGAARYFARSDDAEGDLISVLGFDDDKTVFNYVAGAIGRPDLKVAF